MSTDVFISTDNDISDPSDKDEVESKQVGRQGGLQSGSCALWTSLFGDDDGGEDGNAVMRVVVGQLNA